MSKVAPNHGSASTPNGSTNANTSKSSAISTSLTSQSLFNSPSRPPFHQILPPLILGTATFNTQYVPDPLDPSVLPVNAIVRRALERGVTAFDTSPYYGPSETLLGNALSSPDLSRDFPRDSYLLLSKAGRIGPNEFDYSYSWLRYSVLRSLERLGNTDHLDVVYLHDVEFVSADEVLEAVRALRRLRDEEGVLRYVGISGYPVKVLAELAQRVRDETGEPLDVVMSYGHFTVQNQALGDAVDKLRVHAGVDVVANASMLGMGLLTSTGAGVGQFKSWHPAPEPLQERVAACAEMAKGKGERMEEVALRWSLEEWARVGAQVGVLAEEGLVVGEGKSQRVGVSVMGVANVSELDETVDLFKRVLDGFSRTPGQQQSEGGEKGGDRNRKDTLDRREQIRDLASHVRELLGSEWCDYSWASPSEGWTNKRAPEKRGVVPIDDGVLERWEGKNKSKN